MAFTRSGMEYGLIDKLLATGQTTKPHGRLRRLRTQLVKDQIAQENEVAAEEQHQVRRAEDMSDYAQKLKLQDQYKQEEERRKRLAMAGM